jgi:hypothetical protein
MKKNFVFFVSFVAFYTLDRVNERMSASGRKFRSENDTRLVTSRRNVSVNSSALAL